MLAVWSILTALGLILALAGLVDARRDQEALGGIKRNGRHLVADHAVIKYLARLGIYLSWIGAAVAAYSREGELFGACLIVANLLLMVTSASDLYVGRTLRKMYGHNRHIASEADQA